jgi:hypothetical protein
MPPENQRDYAVGYGRPPPHSRFKKGQSGNPWGRPPGAKNLKTVLNEALNERVIVVEKWPASENHQVPGHYQASGQSVGQGPIGAIPRSCLTSFGISNARPSQPLPRPPPRPGRIHV